MKTISILTSALALAAISAAQPMQRMDMARYGGPTYTGKPALAVTSSLLAAGGGAGHFSIARALTSMVGSETVQAELEKLTKQYGKARVSKWVEIFDFAVADSVKMAVAARVQIPAPNLKGKFLAGTLIRAAMDKDGTVYTELLLDKAVTHGIHARVMDDIDSKFGASADLDYHRITNQALYDLGQALSVSGERLARLH